MTELYADLHSHTTCSDGILPVRDLVQKAIDTGFTALSITDHDTMAAHRLLKKEALPSDFSVVPGIELSCHDFGRDIHVLGYFLDMDNEDLQGYERAFHQDREDRAKRMVRQLQDVGAHITFDDVMDHAGTAPIGRPHVAAALIANGHVATISEAFDRYLEVGKPGYASRSPFSVRQAVEVIRAADGISIVAHPHRTFTEKHLLLNLLATGIDGVEVHHPSHWPTTRDYYARVAAEHGLLVTGGSDFHGTRDYDDYNFGTFGVTQELFDALHTKHVQRRLHGH